MNMIIGKILVILVLVLGIAKGDVRKFKLFPKITASIEYDRNENCENHTGMYEKSLKSFSTWAHKMQDASSKGDFGVLNGNAYQMGNLDECLRIEKPFPTQYCMVTLKINSTMVNVTQKQPESRGSIFAKLQKPNVLLFQERDAIKVGLCLPASCLLSDITRNLKLKSPINDRMVTYAVTTHESLCRRRLEEASKLQSEELVFCALSAVLIVLVALSTVIDFIVPQNSNNKLVRAAFLFSARKSWNGLFQGYDSKVTSFLDGVRTIAMICIIYAHQVIGTMGFIPWMNLDTMEKSSDSRLIMVFEKLDLTVDTFFLLSGLLLSFNVLKKRKDEKISSLGLILLRYIRLMPLYGYASYMYRTMNFFTFGPLGKHMTRSMVENCRNNWYWNFLLSINFVPHVFTICNDITWFIACEFQLFIVGVFTIVFIRKRPKMRNITLSFLFFCSLVIPFAVIIIFKIKPFLGVGSFEDSYNYGVNYYTKPYTRASSYVVGLFGGIIFSKLSCWNYKLSQVHYYLITSSSTLLIAMVFGYLPISYNGHNHIVEMAFYGALHRAIWSIALLGIFVALSFGPSTSLVKSFLSSSFWIPLSKLTYAVFVSQMFVIFVKSANTMTIVKMTHFYVITNGITDICLIFLVGLLLYVVVEIPMRNIFNAILAPLYNSRNKKIEMLEKTEE